MQFICSQIHYQERNARCQHAITGDRVLMWNLCMLRGQADSVLPEILTVCLQNTHTIDSYGIPDMLSQCVNVY